MPRFLLFIRLSLFIVFFFAFRPAWGEELRIAAASNFAGAMKTLSARFEKQTGHKLVLIFGGTGIHYAQIKNGAGFDLFFSADTRRPMLLEQDGVGIRGSRFTYAEGRLVLWSPKANVVDAEGEILINGGFRHLSIANPKVAPYGKAAKEVLEEMGLWKELRKRLVRGKNIAQAFQFVQNGGIELGFVAYSQIKGLEGEKTEGSYWEIPRLWYQPIRQQAMLLKDSPAARAFLDFVKGEEARKVIQSYGYETP